MNAHHVKTAIAEEGKLSLQDLPFSQGDEVEIFIIKRNYPKTTVDSYSLKGNVIRYNNSCESAVYLNN